jgi:uncharacterized membrane protein
MAHDTTSQTFTEEPATPDVLAARDERAPSPQAPIQLGLIASTSLSAEEIARLAAELAGRLSQRYPSVRWEVLPVRDRLVTPPVKLTELVDAARARLLEEDWDLAVLVTDLPLRLGHRPLLTHSSPTHGVALVSLPALGSRRVTERLLESIVHAVGVLVGDAPLDASQDRRGRVRRRLAELATHTDESGAEGVAFLARVITGNIRLLLGMIRANKPLRLVGRLTRALVGAIAAGTFALVSDDLWRMAASLDVLNLAILSAGAIAIAIVTMISAHRLWEHAEDPRVREQVTLFNLVTLITVTFGVVSLYAVILVVTLSLAAVMIEPSLFESAVGHPVEASEYLRLAWLASTLATVGGALGGVLESDETVHEAAYAYRAEDEAGLSPE